MKRYYNILSVVLTTFVASMLFTACIPDSDVEPKAKYEPSGCASEKIIVLNEGNWQADNGRITYFEDGEVLSNEWFREVNGYKLGDTPNDVIQVPSSQNSGASGTTSSGQGLLAIAVNWSNIVQFIKPNGKAVAATEDVPNCRCLASDGSYVYVSSYGHQCGSPEGSFYKTFTKGYVAKIDIKTFKIVDAVEVGYEPEGIAYYNGYLFVANTGGYAFQESHDYETTVSVINASTMQVEKTIDTGIINLYGKMSQSGRYLLINSPGDYYDNAACSLVFDCEKALAGTTSSSQSSGASGTTGSGQGECFVKLGYPATYSTVTLDGKFYAIGSGFSYTTGEYTFNYATIDPAEVMRTNGSSGVTETLPGTMLSDIKGMTSPYDIYVNPYTGYMYATDAGSYASAGKMYQWSPEGELQGIYKVYINPSHIIAMSPD